MKTKLFILSILLVFNLACSGSQTTSFGDTADAVPSGTIVYNPVEPVKAIIPDFNSYVPQLQTEKGLGDDQDNDLVFQFHQFNMIKEFHDETYLSKLTTFGESVADEINVQADSEMTQELKTVVLNAQEFLGFEGDWNIEYSLDSKSSDYYRFYFKHGSTKEIYASYLYKVNENKEPIKGMLVIVNPKIFEKKALMGSRMMMVIYDFTDTTQNKLVIRFDRLTKTNKSMAGQMFVQCDSEVGDCMVEQQVIDSKAPVRKMKEPILRYSYTEASSEVCLASVSYKEGQVVLSETSLYLAETGALNQTSCEIKEPVWGEHVFTSADILLRFDDTAPYGGTAKAYYVDGISKEGWEKMMSEEIIDQSLDASGLVN